MFDLEKRIGYLAADVILALLPGPGRRRLPSPYRFILSYRTEEPQTTGCLCTWEVLGGRLEYQIALEREETGDLRYHCTCADAIYRGADLPHVCKHVRGLLALGRPARIVELAS
jgi:hypothetical protein